MNTIVTAADFKYWRCLYQFLRSLERRGIQRHSRVLVYDLGLTQPVLERLSGLFPWCSFETFRFEKYPPHVALARRNYAWKPLIIAELAEGRGLLLWFDSATLLHTGDLSPIWDQIRTDGVYVTKGQGSLALHCDPLVLEALQVPDDVRRQPERVAGVMGFDCDNPAIRRLVVEWRDHALNEMHISPRNPPLALHRYEQALLTILLHRYEAGGLLRQTDAQIDVSCGTPIKWMSSRNKVKNWMPFCADPFVRTYYRLYKTIDEALWRLKTKAV